ncbi:MAG: hypothetical protein LBG87_04510 [Spirochaetaceae bacterium]|jgi:hypothetical protein|nr:hypothetical protein [Spirochaetaceae bacterium]
MESMVIDRQILPEPIFSYIHSEKIRIFKENGNVILSPLKNKPDINELFGMFTDGKLSSDDFIKQNAFEKEMEN